MSSIGFLAAIDIQLKDCFSTISNYKHEKVQVAFGMPYNLRKLVGITKV